MRVQQPPPTRQHFESDGGAGSWLVEGAESDLFTMANMVVRAGDYVLCSVTGRFVKGAVPGTVTFHWAFNSGGGLMEGPGNVGTIVEQWIAFPASSSRDFYFLGLFRVTNPGVLAPKLRGASVGSTGTIGAAGRGLFVDVVSIPS